MEKTQENDGAIAKMHEEQAERKIEELEKKIDVTEYNIEVSDEIIAETPSNAHRDRMREKNAQRRHAIGSMKKEIRDMEQAIEERGKEAKT